MAADQEAEAKGIICDVCGIFCHSEYSHREHLRGRTHQINLDKYNEAEKMVYVKGFPPNVESSDLKEQMSEFGQVISVWIDPAKIYALVQFQSSADALKALQSSTKVLMSGKRIVIKPRKVKIIPLRKKNKESKDTGEETPVNKYRGLDPKLVELLSQPKPINDQISLLSQHNKMPSDAIKTQLELCHLLQTQLSSEFPHCMLVPFGAAVSGHGTVTSDCDVCLMTDPSERIREIFSPASYYPREVFAIWKEVVDKQDNEGTTINLPTTTPTSVTMETQDDVDDSPNTSLTSSSSNSSPPPKPIVPKRSPEFKKAYSVISAMSEVTRVLPLPHARCPIIRFQLKSTNLHCDLSFNNRLGPCNTRLMQAYYNFDGRFSLLIPIVRLWMKVIGPPRNQINNYAVSLMLIYALQRCSPPVLPCLQEPGAWPKNMKWFGEKGFSVSAERKKQDDAIMVGKWHCGFTPPESLLPSSSTQTPVSLLLHFFNFYSQFQQVVTIHCSPERTLTIDDAVRLANRNPSINTAAVAVDSDPIGPHDKLTKFVVSSPLCVQDPFELNHNIVKSLTKGGFAMMAANMKTAAMILEKQVESDDGSLLAIFEKGAYKAVSLIADLPQMKVIMFNKNDIVTLLDGSDEFKVLASRLDELDLSNEATLQSLRKVVLRVVTRKLESEMKFIVSPAAVTEEEEAMEQDEPVQDVIPPSTEQVETAVVNEAAAIESELTAPPRKRQRSETEEAELSTQTTDEGSTVMEDKEEECIEEVKRCKTDSKVAALDLLNQLTANVGAERYLCKAFENTWLHSRRARRQQKQKATTAAATASVDPTQAATNQTLLDALPENTTPVIHVALSLTPVVSLGQPIEGMICAIAVHSLKVLNRATYGQWFAVFRKMVQSSKPPEQAMAATKH